MKIAITVLLACFVLIATRTMAQTWTQTMAPSNNWNSIACSANGSKVIASAGQIDVYDVYENATATGGVYTSTNWGTTWSLVNLPVTNWASVASSADGSVLAAAYSNPEIIGSGVYISTDFGSTWMQYLTNEGPFDSVVVSATGINVFVTELGSGQEALWVSTNSGANWLERIPVEYYTDGSATEAPSLVACSADGVKLIGRGAGGYLYAATNPVSVLPFGWAWNQLTNAPAEPWSSVVSSPDGSRLFGIVSGPYSDEGLITNAVYLSTNTGASWIKAPVPAWRAPDGNVPQFWDSIACSADGAHVIAVTARRYYDPASPIYTSADCGFTWTTNYAAGTPFAAFESFWSAVAASADGGVLYAADYDGGIYMSQTTPQPRLNLAALNGNLNLSWTIPSTNFWLQQSCDLGNNVWVTLTNQPEPDFTNLQEQLTLRPAGSNAFYRLIEQ